MRMSTGYMIPFKAIAERKTVSVLIVGWSLITVAACQTLGLSEPPLIASLRTDSTEIGVRHSTGAYFAKIGFTYTNTTKKPVSKVGCGFPPFPTLKKTVNERWITAYYPVYLACLSKPDFMLRSGEEYHGELEFMAYEPGHNTFPILEVDSIEGTYRLQWVFSEGTDATAKGARRVQAISNEFRMVLRAR